MGIVSKSKKAIRLHCGGLAALSTTIIFILITAYLAEAAPPGQSATEGAAIFQQKCKACHTIGGGDLVGPDLKGVTTLRSQDWLTSWLLAPDKMLAAGDPTAVQLLQQYKNVPMPNLGLTDAQVASLIAYLAAPETAVQPTAAPPAILQAGNPSTGKLLFTGTSRPQNGGPPCMDCHNVAGVGSLGGGSLGPDLTGAFNKYGGDAGLANFLATTPTLTMTAVWSRQPLTPREQADLKEFLKQASNAAIPAQTTGLLAGLAVAGTILLLAVAQIVWRKRLVAVRQPLVSRKTHV